MSLLRKAVRAFLLVILFQDPGLYDLLCPTQELSLLFTRVKVVDVSTMVTLACCHSDLQGPNSSHSRSGHIHIHVRFIRVLFFVYFML